MKQSRLMSMAEAVLPMTAPASVSQLTLFD